MKLAGVGFELFVWIFFSRLLFKMPPFRVGERNGDFGLGGIRHKGGYLYVGTTCETPRTRCPQFLRQRFVGIRRALYPRRCLSRFFLVEICLYFQHKLFSAVFIENVCKCELDFE